MDLETLVQSLEAYYQSGEHAENGMWVFKEELATHYPDITECQINRIIAVIRLTDYSVSEHLENCIDKIASKFE